MLTIGSLIALTLLGFAQTTPPGFPAPPTQSGPATIAGTIEIAGGGAVPPLVVVAVPEDPTQRTGPLASARLKRVEASGNRFEIGGLPPGMYRVAAADPNALADWPDDALLSRLARIGLPVPVSPGERLEVQITVSAEAGIRRITGGRMMRTETMLVRQGGPGRSAAPIPAGARGLPPGIARGPSGSATITGVVTADGTPVAGVSVAAFRWLTRNDVRQPVPIGATVTTLDDGAYSINGLQPGEYLVAAFADGTGIEAITGTPVGRLPPSIPGPDGTPRGFATTFHPSEVTAVAGASIALGPTDARSGIDIAMARVSVTEISGRFIDPDGNVITGPRAILQPADPAAQLMSRNVRAVPFDADGYFRFTDVPFGAYLLGVMGPGMWGETRVVAGRTPVTRSDFPLDPPIGISGRVEFGGPAPAPASFEGVFVWLRPAEMRTGASGTRTRVGPDGVFDVQGKPGMTYRLEVEAPQPWHQIFGLIGTQDTLDRPFLLETRRDDARLVLASHDTSVSILVIDGDGRPFDDGRIVIYPVSPALRRGNSRYIRLGRPALGRFTASLPPGDYYVAAGPHIAPEGRIAMSELIPLEEESTRFSLAIGEEKRVELVVRRRD